MYFLSSVAHWLETEDALALAKEDVEEVEPGVVVLVGTVVVARVEAEVVAATANLLLSTTAAAGLEEAGLAFEEVTLELVFVFKVVAAAEELDVGVLETLLEAEEAALELAFELDVGVLEMLLEAEEAVLEPAFELKVVAAAEELDIGVLETLLEAEGVALELAFELRLETSLVAELALGVLET